MLSLHLGAFQVLLPAGGCCLSPLTACPRFAFAGLKRRGGSRGSTSSKVGAGFHCRDGFGLPPAGSPRGVCMGRRCTGRAQTEQCLRKDASVVGRLRSVSCDLVTVPAASRGAAPAPSQQHGLAAPCWGCAGGEEAHRAVGRAGGGCTGHEGASGWAPVLHGTAARLAAAASLLPDPLLPAGTEQRGRHSRLPRSRARAAKAPQTPLWCAGVRPSPPCCPWSPDLWDKPTSFPRGCCSRQL